MRLNQHHSSKSVDAQKKEIQSSVLSYKETFQFQFFDLQIQAILYHLSTSSIVRIYSFHSICSKWMRKLQ